MLSRYAGATPPNPCIFINLPVFLFLYIQNAGQIVTLVVENKERCAFMNNRPHFLEKHPGFLKKVAIFLSIFTASTTGSRLKFMI